MGAYIELLASGTPGALTLDMLRRLGRQVVRSSTFPPPDGFSSWADGDAVDELICAMFVENLSSLWDARSRRMTMPAWNVCFWPRSRTG
jgi:hypothetical protein